MNIFEYVILVATLLSASTIFYWAIIRPYILESAFGELSLLRSEMDWAIIEEKEGSQTRSAQAVVRLLNGRDLTRFVSMSHVVFCDMLWRRAAKIAAAAEQELTFDNAPIWVLEIYKRLIKVRIKTMLANSPMWWIPISLVLLGAYFSQKIAKWWQGICIAMLHPHFTVGTMRPA
jgi:hypothetical protein